MKRVVFWGLIVPALLRRVVPGWFLEPPLRLAARHPRLSLAAVVLAAALGGFLVAASGVMPLRASAGHWAITEWLLHFALRRSIATHALPLVAPPLDDPALTVRGAGHYELGCAPCHGSVARRQPRIPQAMLPPPPDLVERTPAWTDEELFYIVKHGVKFTGMPAWPSQTRDDEVWAVVAFLRRLPGLDETEYRRLAAGDAPGALWELPQDPAAPDPSPAIIRDNCARCHGADGAGRGGAAFPRLAGQRAEYMTLALRAYADGRRHSGMMGPIAASLTSAQRNEAVEYYASLPPAPSSAPARPASTPQLQRGARIATQGLPDRLIPACVECHGPAPMPREPAYPRLAGQYGEYLAQQLRLLREGRRGGSEYVHLMRPVAGSLTDEAIQDVSAYFASLDAP